MKEPLSESVATLPDRTDVVILGAGGAGYPAAFFLDRAGMSVVMVDPIGNLGGDCLAEGCVPSKAIREAALVRRLTEKYAHFGLQGGACNADWPAVQKHKDRVQQIRYTQHEAQIAASNVTFVKGRGAVIAPDRVRITAPDATAAHEVEFRYLILATGSRPTRLSIPGAELAITSHDLFRFGSDITQPKHIIIIGGGYIGVETASMLQGLGTKATIMEFTPQLLPGFDSELSEFLRAHLEERIDILLSAKVTAIERIGGGYSVSYLQNGQEHARRCDAVLMSTGRAPVLPEGVEYLALRFEEGRLAVDETLRTSNQRVWAPGDVNARSMLFHSAVRQSLVAAHCIAAGGQAVERMNFAAVPMTVFSEPELAHVGLTAEQAESTLGIGAVSVTRYSYDVDSRAQIYGECDGFLKLVFDRRDGKLLGAQIAGIDAAQLIAPLALAIERGLGAVDLAATAFPHPMISEGLAHAARAFRP